MFLQGPSRNVQFEAMSNETTELKQKKEQRLERVSGQRNLLVVSCRKEVRWPDLVFI